MKEKLDNNVVEVHLRGENDESSRFLCWCPITDLEDLINEVKRWGAFSHGEVYEDAFGQFVVKDPWAVFEIVGTG